MKIYSFGCQICWPKQFKDTSIWPFFCCWCGVGSTLGENEGDGHPHTFLIEVWTITLLWINSMQYVLKWEIPFLKMFIDFRQRGRKRERETSKWRETSQLVASHMCPDQGLNSQPRYVPGMILQPSHTNQGDRGNVFDLVVLPLGISMWK